MAHDTMIQDPFDGSVWFIGSAAEAELGAQVGSATLYNVHAATACAGLPCVVHNPSDHRMRRWALNWRDDRGIMERLCAHGIGHPDPDDAAYQISAGRSGQSVHGCDGCCSTSNGSVFAVGEPRDIRWTWEYGAVKAPCPQGPHRAPQGPNEDLAQCRDCRSMTYTMRPDGETYGDHLPDCSLPIRHESFCRPGGAGHPSAALIRGYWPSTRSSSAEPGV